MLGTARGPAAAQLSLNGGKSWLALGPRSLPLLPGTEIRSRSGTADLVLADGSRITALPFTSLTFHETFRGTGVSIAYGRLTFNLGERATTEVVTPTTRLEPAGQRVDGELFVTNAGLTGIKIGGGTLTVTDLTRARQVMVAGLAPVFVPARPRMPGLYFGADAPPTPAANARAVFMPDGRSIGYLHGHGALVIAPGFTRSLTRPFPPRLVRVATNALPEKDRVGDATPLFDVNGGYLGYLSGPVFYAQARTLPAGEMLALSGSASIETLAAASMAMGQGSTEGECVPPPEATPPQPPSCGS